MSRLNIFTISNDGRKRNYANCKNCNEKNKIGLQAGFYGNFICTKCNYLNKLIFIQNERKRIIKIIIIKAVKFKKISFGNGLYKRPNETTIINIKDINEILKQ